MISETATSPTALAGEPPPEDPSPEALIEEARRVRRGRRWRTFAGVACVLVLATVLGLVAGFGWSGRGGTPRPGTPSVRPPTGASAPRQTAAAGSGVVGRGPTAIDFLDADHGWVASGGGTDSLGTPTNPTIVSTSSGGQSWERTPVPKMSALTINPAINRNFGGLVGIHFSSPNRGWYFQDGLGWQTNDAGTTWSTMRFPNPGALVAVSSSGDDVWALLDTCPTGIVSCPQSMGRMALYHAVSAPRLSWVRVGAPFPKGSAGYGSLYPATDGHVVIAVGDQIYGRSLHHTASEFGSGINRCEPVGTLAGGRLAGVCAVGGGGNAGSSSVGVSADKGATWQPLLGGPPSTQFVGELTTNGADAVFYVTGGQQLWRTATDSPGWTDVLEVPSGSTESISPIFLKGAFGLALVTNGLDAHWFETKDAGLTWQPVTLP
jgi:hypothetical protein